MTDNARKRKLGIETTQGIPREKAMTAIQFLLTTILPAVLMSQDSKACLYTWRAIMDKTEVVWQR